MRGQPGHNTRPGYSLIFLTSCFENTANFFFFCYNFIQLFILHQMTVQVAERSYHDLSMRQHLMSTVPTFNSCTKRMDRPGIIRDRTSECQQLPGHECMDDVTTERCFISKLRVSLIRLAYSLMYNPWVFYNKALATVLSTGAESKCLYCSK